MRANSDGSKLLTTSLMSSPLHHNVTQAEAGKKLPRCLQPSHHL